MQYRVSTDLSGTVAKGIIGDIDSLVDVSAEDGTGSGNSLASTQTTPDAPWFPTRVRFQLEQRRTALGWGERQQYVDFMLPRLSCC